jgi:Holliday junction resolvase-like predicted endonuclease
MGESGAEGQDRQQEKEREAQKEKEREKERERERLVQQLEQRQKQRPEVKEREQDRNDKKEKEGQEKEKKEDQAKKESSKRKQQGQGVRDEEGEREVGRGIQNSPDGSPLRDFFRKGAVGQQRVGNREAPEEKVQDDKKDLPAEQDFDGSGEPLQKRLPEADDQRKRAEPRKEGMESNRQAGLPLRDFLRKSPEAGPEGPSGLERLREQLSERQKDEQQAPGELERMRQQLSSKPAEEDKTLSEIGALREHLQQPAAEKQETVHPEPDALTRMRDAQSKEEIPEKQESSPLERLKESIREDPATEKQQPGRLQGRKGAAEGAGPGTLEQGPARTETTGQEKRAERQADSREKGSDRQAAGARDAAAGKSPQARDRDRAGREKEPRDAAGDRSAVPVVEQNQFRKGQAELSVAKGPETDREREEPLVRAAGDAGSQQPQEALETPSDRGAVKLAPKELPRLEQGEVGPPTNIEVISARRQNSIQFRSDKVSTPEQVASYLFSDGKLPEGTSLNRSGEDPYLWYLNLGKGDHQYLLPAPKNAIAAKHAEQMEAIKLGGPQSEITQLPYLSKERSEQIFRGELPTGNYELDGVFFSIRPSSGFAGALRIEAVPVKSENLETYQKIAQDDRHAQNKLEAAKMWNKDMRWMLEKGFSVQDAVRRLDKLYNTLSKMMIAGTALAFANMGGSITAEASFEIVSEILADDGLRDAVEQEQEKEILADGQALGDAFNKAVVTAGGQAGSQAAGDIASTAREAGTRFTGALGEKIARRVLSSRGYTDIVAIQNTSGQGIDLVARSKHGLLVPFEVKTSGSERSPRLSQDQRNASDFLRDRLQRIVSGEGHFKNVSRATRRNARNLLPVVEQMIAEGRPIGGVVIEITSTKNLAKFDVSVRRWSSSTPAARPRRVRINKLKI